MKDRRREREREREREKLPSDQHHRALLSLYLSLGELEMRGWRGRGGETLPAIQCSAVFLLGVVLLLFAAPTICDPSLQLLRRPGLPPKTVFSVDRFGAIGDGLEKPGWDRLAPHHLLKKKRNSFPIQAFLRTWQAVCSSPIQAVLKVPPQKIYLIWPTDFSGPCSSNSTFLILGTIIAPGNPDLWPDRNPRKWLFFNKLNNLILRGGGVIDGKGEKWWAQSCKIKKKRSSRKAPTAVNFHRCKNLRIKDLTLMNSQRMHLTLTSCSSAKISDLQIFAPADSPNTDGIHISSSSHVEIKNIEIRTGDDCISIASESSMVNIRDVHCGPGHGISIGSLGNQGSWSNVSGIRVNGVTFTNTSNGFRIKTWQGGRGFARRIDFQNSTMRNVSNPIIIDQYYCDSSRPCPNKTSAVKVEEVSFKNIRGTSTKKVALKFACSDEFPCEKIVLKNIQLILPSGDQARSYIWKAQVSCSGSVDPPVCDRYVENLKFLYRETLLLVSNWIGSVLSRIMGYYLL